MDWSKPFLVKNISHGRIVVGALVVQHNEAKEVNPLHYSNKAIEQLRQFHMINAIEVTNDFIEAKKADGNSYGVSKIESIKNIHGETNSHVIFDPHKAINTEIISTGKAIKVENLTSESSAVEVEYSEIDEIEAREFLNKHWKTVQADVNKLTNKRKLNFYLSVATEWAVADKKIEILKNRITEL